jgi:PAS domain S-box-containing protein
LRRALSLLAATLESTWDGILVVDLAGRIVRYNRQFAEMWRIPPEIVARRDDDAALAFVLDQLVDPDGFLRKVRELYARRAAESFDLLEFRDGRVFQRCSRPQRVGRKVVGRVWSFRDVTDRRRSEDEIRRRQAQLAEAQAIANLGIWEWDMVRDRAHWSDEVYRAYGVDRSRGPLSFAQVAELVAPEDRERSVAHIRAAQDRAQAAFRARGERESPIPPIDYRVIHPDGASRTLCGRGQVLLDEAGKPLRMVGTVLDITDRKRTEEALAASEGRLRAIIESEPECVKLVAPDGRLLDMNQAGLAMVEADSLEQVLGAPVLDLVVPEHREAYRALHRKVLEGHTGMLAYEIVGLKGGRRWMETHAAPLRGWSGEVVAHLAVTRDVTQRRRAEEQLAAGRRRLREVFRRLRDAHEEERARLARELHDQVGQALTAIKLNLEAIGRSGVSGSTQTALAEGIQLVDGALQQVRTLSFDLRPAALDDLGLAAALRSFARRHAGPSGLRLGLHLDPPVGGIPKDVETACFRIAQEAITNVLRHARARRLDVRLRRMDGMLELVVADDGVGIASAREAVMSGAGAGLGFLSMQERAGAVGGGVEFESRARKGTVVRARFPLTRTERDRGGQRRTETDKTDRDGQDQQ